MNRLLPFQSSSRPKPEQGARIVEIDDQAAGEVFEALASDTTREVLTAIYENPGTASEIAETVDTSLQNVKYHLSKLQEANLIEVAETWYSEQGNEMKVYAATSESVVMLAGDNSTRSSLRETLSRLLGTIGVLGIGSLLIEKYVFASVSHYQSSQPSSPTSWRPFFDVGAHVSPGVVFFIGGLVATVTLILWSYLYQ